MNTRLFRPLTEQIEAVKIKNESITESEFNEAANNTIFNNEIQSLTESIEISTKVALNERATFHQANRLKKKLYQLEAAYENETNQAEKEKIFQKIEKLKAKMEKLGYNSNTKYVDDETESSKDKKLLKAAENYENVTDPELKEKAMKKYDKRSEKLAKKGKPNKISYMEVEKAKDQD